MSARRDFQYRRSHRNVARDALPLQPSSLAVASGNGNGNNSPSPPGKGPDPFSPVMPGPIVPATSPASSSSPAEPTPSSYTLDTPSQPTSSNPSSNPPPSSASASASPTLSSTLISPTVKTSSSPVPTTSSVVSTPPTLAPTFTAQAASVSTRVNIGTTLIHTSSVSPSPTSLTSSSSGTNTSAIVGGIAGTLAGIAVLGYLLMWCMRRQRNRDTDDFDASAFKRQSTMLVDDPAEVSRSHNPRPPTMIEHHNASPALAAQVAHDGQNFYGGYGGYGQQHSFAPEMVQPLPAPPQAYGSPPMGYANYTEPRQQIPGQPLNVGYAGYDSQQQLVRQPSNPAYLTQQLSSGPGYVPPAPPGSHDPNSHYVDLDRSGASPYQATQYADISRQLGAPGPNGQHPSEPSEPLDGPLPSPFDDPVKATPAPDATSHPHPDQPSDVPAPGPASTVPAPQTQGNTTEAHIHQRPQTVYNEGDAYDGI